jgi:hypothetical protein
MIQMNIVPKTPNKVRFESLFMLKHRNTYLGVHRDILRPDMEVGCSKTAMLGFIKERDAIRFKDLIIAQQKKKKVLDRTLVRGSYMDFVEQDAHRGLRPIQSIELESIPRLFLLNTCAIQYLDLYMIDDFSKSSQGAYPVEWNMYCYEARTDALPRPEALSYLYSG